MNFFENNEFKTNYGCFFDDILRKQIDFSDKISEEVINPYKTNISSIESNERIKENSFLFKDLFDIINTERKKFLEKVNSVKKQNKLLTQYLNDIKEEEQEKLKGYKKDPSKKFTKKIEENSIEFKGFLTPKSPFNKIEFDAVKQEKNMKLLATAASTSACCIMSIVALLNPVFVPLFLV